MADRERLAADELNRAVDDIAERLRCEDLAGDAFVDDVLTGFTEARGAIQHAARRERPDAQIRIAQSHAFARAERLTGMVRRLQMLRREVDRPSREADGLGGDQE